MQRFNIIINRSSFLYLADGYILQICGLGEAVPGQAVARCMHTKLIVLGISYFQIKSGIQFHRQLKYSELKMAENGYSGVFV